MTRCMWVMCILMASACGDDAATAPDAPGVDAAPSGLYTPAEHVEIESTELRDRVMYMDVLGNPRTVNLKVYRPTTGGPYPVVLLSHGGAGGRQFATTAMDKWADEIARAGYIAIALAHAGREQASYDALCAHLGVPADVANFQCAIKINFDRPNDIDAVIDYMLANRDGPGWENVDLERLAHVGHSAGGGAAMRIAGAQSNYVCAQPYGYNQGTLVPCDPADLIAQAEPRIDAVLALSPQGPDTDGFMTQSFGTVQVPLMMGTGASDGDPGEPASRVALFPLLPDSQPHWKLYVDDPAAIHVLFEGELENCATMSSLERCTEMRSWIFASGLAFLDAQLKDRAEAHAWLASGSVESVSNDDATLEAEP